MLKFHKSESACRICKHHFNHHCIYVEVKQGYNVQPFIQPLEMVPCDNYANNQSGLNMTEKCGCLMFEPMDNLEYLELKAEQSAQPTEDTW